VRRESKHESRRHLVGDLRLWLLSRAPVDVSGCGVSHAGRALSADALVNHVTLVAARFRTIAFVIRRATASRNPIAGNSHVFLTPDEGREAMIALHDGLYGDALQVHLRHDIPFEPHITVATLETFEECDGLTHAMNGAFPTIRGVVNALDVVAIEPTAVRTIRSVPLT
jgi:hypothetical protein